MFEKYMVSVRFKTKPIALALGATGELPTEFRIFVRGWNDSEKGRFLFDDEAARLTIAAYERWGVDLAIDLEHQMLESVGSDPCARDARGWCRLELRNDGSLWAVNVTWTPDGAARLAEKRQRYISPAFRPDPETKRVIEVINIALVAMPATHHTPALVAASMSGAGMDPSQISEALDALIAGDAEKCMALLKGIITTAAGGDADATTEDAPPPMGDAGADETTESAVPVAPNPGDKNANIAATSRLFRLSGKTSLIDAMAEIETWRASHIELAKDRASLAREREALESAERRRLCVELISLGAEFPATVWADAKALALKPRWRTMPLVELKSTVADQRAARGKPRMALTPPRGAAIAGGDVGEQTFNVEGRAVTLTARELAKCAEKKCDPNVYAALKARAEKDSK